MATKSTQPDEKGFFEKVKETIEEFWDGTKDNKDDIKNVVEEKIKVLKKSIPDKKSTPVKTKATTAKDKTASADVKTKADTKGKQANAKKELLM